MADNDAPERGYFSPTESRAKEYMQPATPDMGVPQGMYVFDFFGMVEDLVKMTKIAQIPEDAFFEHLEAAWKGINALPPSVTEGSMLQ